MSDGRRYSNDSIALQESSLLKNKRASSNDISKNFEGGGGSNSYKEFPSKYASKLNHNQSYASQVSLNKDKHSYSSQNVSF